MLYKTDNTAYNNKNNNFYNCNILGTTVATAMNTRTTSCRSRLNSPDNENKISKVKVAPVFN